MTKTKRIAFLGLTVAAAIILSYIEAVLPPILTIVPGIKIGLPNIVIVFALYRLSLKDAVLISFIRIFVIALLFGNAVSLAYSVVGALLSLLMMSFLKKTKIFSTVGVSVCGAVAHNIGQILVAIFIMKTVQIGYYLAVLALSGVVTGIVIGLSGALILNYSKRFKL